MNRITHVFSKNQGDKLAVYFTAGFPGLHDTLPILQALQQGGVDLVEIGMPYSDPIADGPTIQMSNEKALAQGMSISLLFEQLKSMRSTVHVPVLLMGYLNPVLQFGLENFCKKCQEVGIDGLILPDLPIREYLSHYKQVFDTHGLVNTFLVTPQTSVERIRQVDEHSTGFIYMVSSASVTGAKTGISDEQESYFKRVQAMNLIKPCMIGFGISDHESFSKAGRFANGAIIGSAFINMLAKSEDLEKDIVRFVKTIKGNI